MKEHIPSAILKETSSSRTLQISAMIQGLLNTFLYDSCDILYIYSYGLNKHSWLHKYHHL